MKNTNHPELRNEIIDVCRRMNALGINQGTSGNVSARIDGGLLITPSGIPYDDLLPEQIVAMDAEGGYVGDYLPSSEWRMHYDILRHRPEAGAVVHTHAAHCTALACLRTKIPAFHYMIAVAGGKDIRCSDYATYGTQALSDTMLAALEDRRACLLANHGMICFGPNLDKALSLAVEVENLARQYWLARQINPPAILPDEEMQIVLDRIKSYGKQAHELDPDAPPAFIPPPRRDAPQKTSSDPE